MPFVLKSKAAVVNLILILMILLISTTSLSFGVLFFVHPPYIFIALFVLLLLSSSVSVVAYQHLRNMFYGPDPEDEIRELKSELDKIKRMKEVALRKYYGKEINSGVLEKLGKEYEEKIIEKEVLINILVEKSYVDLLSAIIKKYISIMGPEAVDIAKKTGIEVSYEGEFTGRANKDTVSKILSEYEKAKGPIAVAIARDVAKNVLEKTPGLDVPEQLSPAAVFLKKL